LVAADDAEPRRVSDLDSGDVAHPHRHALLREHDHVFDVPHRSYETQPTNGVRLLAHREALATDVLVGAR
jgi:hypothetical protein